MQYLATLVQLGNPPKKGRVKSILRINVLHSVSANTSELRREHVWGWEQNISINKKMMLVEANL